MAGRGRPRLHANRRWVKWAGRLCSRVCKTKRPIEVYVTSSDGELMLRVQGVNHYNHPLSPAAALLGTYTAPFDSRAFLDDLEAHFGVAA